MACFQHKSFFPFVVCLELDLNGCGMEHRRPFSPRFNGTEYFNFESTECP